MKLTLTELLRELGDEQDMRGNLVQLEELGWRAFFVDKSFKCCSQNVVKERLFRQVCLSVCLSAWNDRTVNERVS